MQEHESRESICRSQIRSANARLDGFRHDLAGLADFLSCPTFKWLCGPLGAGFLYVRRDLLELGPPPLVDWMSARKPEEFDVHSMNLHDDARRLQRGVRNAPGLVAALAGLRIVDELGPTESGSTCGGSPDCYSKASRSRILAGQYLPGQIRMDVALFHNEEDIQRTLQAVNEVITRTIRRS